MTLSVAQLGKDYPTRSGKLSVLRDVSFEMKPGEALAILGPSGSGKSTLLHIIGTLDKPSAGSIKIGGQDPVTLKDRDLALFRNRHIGFVFQDHYLLPQCSVLENVLVPTLAAPPENKDDLESRARALLEKVGLSQRLEHRPAELSGGERQRVSLARALILKPSLVLADEPTGNLDRRTAQGIGKLLMEMHLMEQTMLIVVTHSAELARTLPRQMEMDDGTLVPWKDTSA